MRTACTLLVIACSSSKDDEIATRELCRQDVGPAGGVVACGAVTVDVPEGALAETKTIVVNEVTQPDKLKLPNEAQIAGSSYVLEPDDVTFAKPVTITVQIDPSKKRADGKGALMLFRGTGGAAWTPYGADETSASVVVGKTTHFSTWAPTTAPETYCYMFACTPFDRSGGPNDPNAAATLPGLDCRVPNDGDKGVACTGLAPDKGPPYECHCIGSEITLGTWQRLPPDTAVSAMAAQCGAPACPPRPTYACDLYLTCEDNPLIPGGWNCTGARKPRLTCHSDGKSAMCQCGDGGFTLASTKMPSNDDLVPQWQACGGICEPTGNDPNLDGVCQGAAQFDGPNGECVVDSGYTCRDSHAYRAECDKNGTEIGTCKCLVDGVVTKTVESLCIEASFTCGWPKFIGDTDTKQCPRVVEQREYKDGWPVGGCTARTGGLCRDGHVYSAECQLPESAGPCTCMVDGTPTKTVNATCDEAHDACGFPATR